MRIAAMGAAVLGVLVVLAEIPWIGRSNLWIPIMALGAAVLLLAIGQLRHGGHK